MNLILKPVLKKIYFVPLLLLLFATTVSNAQKKTAFLQLFGSVQQGSKNLSGAQLQVMEGGTVIETIAAKDNGSFVVVFDLGKEYSLVFSKPGYVSKSIEVRTVVPPDAADIGYVFKCNVDLPEDVMGLSKSDPMSKPIAKIAYNAGYEDFDYDAIYTRRIKEEQEQAVKDAETLKHDMDKARLDSLNKIWSDSIAKVKEEQAQLASQRAALEKAKQDSILRAQAQAAVFAAAEKSRVDSAMRAEAERKRQEEIAREKSRQDSVNAAMADLKKKQEAEKLAAMAAAREKAMQDSIKKADAASARLAEAARQKAITDSIAGSKAAAEARKKAVADSVAQAQADEAARQKALADAKTAEETRKKFVADSTAKADAEAARLAVLARQKAIADSTSEARAAAEARIKAEADSVARIKAEEAAKLKAAADARAAIEARNKFVADSTARVAADAKAAEEEAQNAEFRHYQDSLIAATKAQKEKAEAERQARIQEDIQARKDALAKANQVDTSRSSASKPTAVPKIRESDYHEGITDETIKETNRSIVRTVVKKEGVTFNYQKITYNWGGIFYYKNEQSITPTLFDQEINNARKIFGK